MPLPEQAPAGLAGALSAGTVVAAPPQAGDVAGLGVPEDERPVDDVGLLGVRQRNLDDVDPEQRRVGVLRRRLVRAAFELVTRPHRGGARPVDVDVALAVGIAHQRVGVGSAAGLHCGHLPRAPHVADVKDTEAPEPLLAHRLRHSLQPAVEAAGYGQGLLDVMASVYPGYAATPSFGQVIIGTLYGMLDGAVVGAVFAWLYNTISNRLGS